MKVPYYAFLLALIVLASSSPITTPSIHEAPRLSASPEGTHYDYVPVIIRGELLRGLRSSRLLVGVWSHNEWLELPFIALPLRVNAFTIGLDVLYRDRPPKDPAAASHVLETHDKLLGKKGGAGISRVSETVYAEPAEIDARQGVLVLLPRWLLSQPHPSTGRWCPEALRLGYTHRATYSYRGVDIEVYYSRSPGARSRAGVLPMLRGNTRITLVSGAWTGEELQAATLIRGLDPADLYSTLSSARDTVPAASLKSLEELPGPPGSSGTYLWYPRYWEERQLSNRIAAGSPTVTLADHFTTKSNTSRLNIHIVLKPLTNTGRAIRVEAYLNGSLVLRESMVEDGKTSYVFEAVVVGSEADMSSGVWEVRVVLSGLDAGASRWMVDAVPTARAWIQPATPPNEVRRMEVSWYGASSVRYVEGGGWLGGQYEVNPETGDAVLVLAGVPNVVEGLSTQRGLVVAVRSVSTQRYDRYVRVYVGGHEAGVCLAHAPGVPNGTASARECSLQVSDISPYIVESLREGRAPLVRVVVEGYVGRPGYDYRSWFVAGASSSFYTRAYSVVGGTMYNADPTLRPGSGLYRYTSLRSHCIGVSYEHSSWLSTCMQRTLVTLGYPPYAPGAQTYEVFVLNISIDSPRLPHAPMSHRLLHAEVLVEAAQRGTVPADVVGIAHAPRGEEGKGLLRSMVDAARRLIAALAHLLSATPGSGDAPLLDPQIADLPVKLHRGASYIAARTDRGVRLVWDSGYSGVSEGGFSLKVGVLPSTPWNSNPIQVAVQGYVQVYVSKACASTGHVEGSSIVSLDVSGRIEVQPGG